MKERNFKKYQAEYGRGKRAALIINIYGSEAKEFKRQVKILAIRSGKPLGQWVIDAIKASSLYTVR